MASDLTYDAFLGGRVQLWQPKSGYRAGVDPVLLAASVDARPGQTVLDLGCGVGAAALCLGARVPNLGLFGVERQVLYAELARRNGLDTYEADIADLPVRLRQSSSDHVICNPPYFDRNAGHTAQDVDREAARGEDTPLKVWLETASRRLKPKGYLHLIHRVDKLPELLDLRCAMGSFEVLPLAAREGRAPERVILRARKEGRAPFVLHSPLVLHAGDAHMRDAEDYTAPVAAALREGKALLW